MKNLILLSVLISILGCKAIPLDREDAFVEYDETSKQALMSAAERNSRLGQLQTQIAGLNGEIQLMQNQITQAEMREMKLRQMDPTQPNPEMVQVQSDLTHYRFQKSNLEARKVSLETELATLQ